VIRLLQRHGIRLQKIMWIAVGDGLDVVKDQARALHEKVG